MRRLKFWPNPPLLHEAACAGDRRICGSIPHRYRLKNAMSNQFPILLAWTFLGSFLLAVLKTGRWKIIFVSMIAAWAASISQAQIDLLTAGTTEGYAWFAFLSAGMIFPAAVVAAIAADIGAALSSLFKPKDIESEAAPEEGPDESGT
jgi:hypothetical protein